VPRSPESGDGNSLSCNYAAVQHIDRYTPWRAKRPSHQRATLSASPSVELQRLEFPRRREPSSLLPQEVCPHCQRELIEYRFCADGLPISTWSCAEHGDVRPVRSAISNPAIPREGAAAGPVTQP
jgi:hypothetical protein